jgi:hypothetical protein
MNRFFLCKLLIFWVVIGCKSVPERNAETEKKLLLLTDQQGQALLDTILIIPVDVSCESCRDKCISILKSGKISHHTVVLTSENPRTMKLFIKDKGIELTRYPILKLDTVNFAFENGLAFVAPVVYYRGFSDVDIQKIDLVPKNIDIELTRLFLDAQ